MKKLLRAAALCGLVAPILAYACILLAVASYAPFSWTENALSDLGVQAGVTAWVFNVGLVAAGLLFLAFSFGLFRLLGKRLVGRVGSVALALACISLVCIGVFNESFGRLHYYVSVAFFVLMPIAMLVLTVGLWVSGQRGLSVFTFALALAAAVPWVLQFTVRYVPNVAVPEFVSGLAGSIWTGVLAVKMLKASDSEQR
ncbi:MAG: DUF998 domain-containing protein [Candidatus Bathyarchaeia archaeon]